jgi:hypothetical protein
VLLSIADFVVAPSPGLIAWTILMGLLLVAGAITAAKGRWGWVLAGLMTGGLLWCVTAFLPAAPGSLWAASSASGPAAE